MYNLKLNTIHIMVMASQLIDNDWFDFLSYITLQTHTSLAQYISRPVASAYYLVYAARCIHHKLTIL